MGGVNVMDYLHYILIIIAVFFGFLVLYFWWESKKIGRKYFIFSSLEYMIDSLTLLFLIIIFPKVIVNVLLQFGFDVKLEVIDPSIIFAFMLFLLGSYYIQYLIIRYWEEKIPDSPKHKLLDSLKLKLDLSRDEKRTAPYVSKSKVDKEEKSQLKSQIWYEQAKELICLTKNKIYFNDDNGWHDEHNCWIGEHIFTNYTVVLFCKHDELTDKDLLLGLDYIGKCESLDENKTDITVAVKNGDIDKDRIFFGYKVKYVSETKFLNKLINFNNNFDNYFQDIKEIVAKDKISGLGFTLNDIYVIPDYSLDDKRQINVIKFIFKWLNKNTLQQLVILGEYGHGKTALARILTYKLLLCCKHSKNVRIPILLELNSKKPHTLTQKELLTNWGKKYGIRYEVLKQLLNFGRLLIIFEGFDEMDWAMDKDLRLESFNKLWKEFDYKNVKLLFTGRPNFFSDTDEQDLCLRTNRSIYKNCGQIVYLEYLRNEQINAILAKVDNNIKDDILNAAKNDIKFKDFISIPSILLMVATIWEPELLKHKEQINSARMIEIYINNIYSHQNNRNISQLSDIEHAYFIDGIAVYMVVNKLSNQIGSEQLSKVIKNLIDKKPKEILSFDNIKLVENNIRTSNFLAKDLTKEDTLKFSYEPFIGFFIAKIFANYVNGNGIDKEIAKSIVNTFKLRKKHIFQQSESREFYGYLLAKK